MVPFYTPLKTPENQRFFGVFRRYKMGTLARNGLKELKSLEELVPFFKSETQEAYFWFLPRIVLVEKAYQLSYDEFPLKLKFVPNGLA